jgi:hypothetical protein
LSTRILSINRGRLVESILGKQVRNAGIDGLRCGYVGLTAESIALLDLGKTASVQGKVQIRYKRGVEIRNGVIGS